MLSDVAEAVHLGWQRLACQHPLLQPCTYAAAVPTAPLLRRNRGSRCCCGPAHVSHRGCMACQFYQFVACTVLAV